MNLAPCAKLARMSRPSAAHPLAGWHVISLRPAGQHAGLRRAAAGRGARVFALSTLRLRPLPASLRKRALAAALLVATSPAAVRFAFADPVPAAALARPWFAPGGGTAAALRRRGVRDVRWPARRADSEGLLALPGLQQVARRRVGVLTAPGGRDLIAATLARRGAEVVRAEVYAREPHPPGAVRLSALDRLPTRTALLVSSAEAFDVLWTALDAPRRARLARRRTVASSERLAAKLRACGFMKVFVAAGARPAQLLDALAVNAGA